MNELSLFTGGGGGLLASILLEWRTIGYVEWDDYCQRILRQRIDDGILHNAPIFGDIRAFLCEGYAERYRGMVDVVSAGFPCQPFSTAGKQLGADDPRNMWPATAKVLDVVRPRYALLENVPAIINSGYFGTILGDMASIGFDVEWDVFSAAGVGAPHLRKRVWILGNANGINESPQREIQVRSHTDTHRVSNEVCNTISERRNAGSRQETLLGNGQAEGLGTRLGDGCLSDADADSEGLSEREGQDAKGTRSHARGIAERNGWWDVEPNVGRVAHGVAHRVDRLKSLGNGQVPLTAAVAWSTLVSRLAKNKPFDA